MYLLNGDSANRKLTYSNDGKAARENTFVLSSDGKTIRETDITPAPSPAKMSVTLHKSQRRHSVLSFCVRQVPVVAICQSIRFSGSCVRLHAIVPATVDAGGLGGLRSNNGFPGSDVLTHRLPWVFRGQSKTPKRSVTVNIQTISVPEKLAQAAGAFKTGLLNDYPPAESFASTAPHEVSATRSWGSAMRR